MEGHAKSAPISRLPLVTLSDAKHHLKDIPVCLVSLQIITGDSAHDLTDSARYYRLFIFKMYLI